MCGAFCTESATHEQRVIMYLAVRPDVDVSYLSEVLQLRNETRTLVIRNVTCNQYEFIKRLIMGIYIDECKVELNKDKHIAELVLILENHQFLYRRNNKALETSNRTAGYWAAKGLNPDVAISKIANSNILILGMGGIGSVVFQHLLSAGVQKTTIVDSDCVELSNLNRQFIYKRSDIGKPKVLAAKCYAHDFFGENISISCKQTAIQTENDLKTLTVGQSFDLAAVCVDQPVGLITDICQRFFTENKIPYIVSGVGVKRGFFGPILDESLPMDADTYTNMRNIPYSFGPTNTITAAFMAQEILEYLAGMPLKHDTYNINFEDYTLVKMKEERCE